MVTDRCASSGREIEQDVYRTISLIDDWSTVAEFPLEPTGHKIHGLSNLYGPAIIKSTLIWFLKQLQTIDNPSRSKSAVHYVVVGKSRSNGDANMYAPINARALSLSRRKNCSRSSDKTIRLQRRQYRSERTVAARKHPENQANAHVSSQRLLVATTVALRTKRLHRHTRKRSHTPHQHMLPRAVLVAGSQRQRVSGSHKKAQDVAQRNIPHRQAHQVETLGEENQISLQISQSQDKNAFHAQTVMRRCISIKWMAL